MVTLYNCFSYNPEWYLIEMALDIPPKEIEFGKIVVPEEGVDEGHWQAVLAEQYLNKEGTEKISRFFQLSPPDNGDTESRVAFFIFKTASHILRTPYGEFELSDAVKVPRRLSSIIEVDEDYIEPDSYYRSDEEEDQ